MERKISVQQARDVDATNAYTVTIDDDFEHEAHDVHTDRRGNGLWIDGRQVCGTSQFSVGSNPREAIRRYFQAL